MEALDRTVMLSGNFVGEFIDTETRFFSLRMASTKLAMRKVGLLSILSPEPFEAACDNDQLEKILTNAKTVLIVNERLFRTAVLADGFASRLAMYHPGMEVAQLCVNYYESLLEEHSRELKRMWDAESELIYLLEKLYDVYSISNNTHFVSGSDDLASRAIVDSRYSRLWEELEEAKVELKKARQFSLLIYRNILSEVGRQARKVVSILR